ncbi:MAG: glycoside hydrolase family 5 protein [Chitinivibrionales bacterium]|nr:glycoside hydrolase family 5 protein [Chitinivibrionales bacterium]
MKGKSKISYLIVAAGTILALFVAVSLGRPLTVFQHNGQLRVSGTKLLNAQGYQIQLRGMSTHGLQWHRGCLTDEALDVLVNTWGADILRLSMYVQEDGLEKNPEGFTRMVDTLVGKVKSRGIYALIDFHQLDPGDPNENVELAKTYFEHMSKLHGGTGQVLYDICNEPNGDGVSWDVITRYAKGIIPIIRANDPKSVIIVGTPTWASEPNAVVNAKLPYENVLYTMHFYAADHKSEYQNNVRQAVNGGVPVFVTEWGSQKASGGGANDWQSTDTWLSLLQSLKISWCNWNYSDDPLSGAVWKNNGTECTFRGPFTDNNLKEAGVKLKQFISSPADDFGPVPTQIHGSGIPQTSRSQPLVSIVADPHHDRVTIRFLAQALKQQAVTLAFYTIEGACVFTHEYPCFSGSLQLIGRRAEGTTLSAGSYLIQASVHGATVNRTMVMIP